MRCGLRPSFATATRSQIRQSFTPGDPSPAMTGTLTCASVLSHAWLGASGAPLRGPRGGGVVELAVVEQDVRVGVGGDGEGALADAGSDQRPGLALPVPEADSPGS